MNLKDKIIALREALFDIYLTMNAKENYSFEKVVYAFGTELKSLAVIIKIKSPMPCAFLRREHPC